MESIKPTNPSFDDTPCNLSNNGNVVCDKVPVKEIQKSFNRTFPFPILASVKLILQPKINTETFIPEDVFEKNRILDIWIEYPTDSVCCDSKLQVDSEAFRSTKSYTTQFTINIIDCTLLDLVFLSGFDKLTNLQLSNINNIQHSGN